MGCGASGAPPEYVPQRAEEQEAPPAQVQEVSSGGFVTVAQNERKDDPVRKKPENFLPFVRRDVSKVAPEIYGGDHIYLTFTHSEMLLGMDGDKLQATSKEIAPSHVFRIWRKDDTNKEIGDGDQVFLEHADSGKYLECKDDTNPMGFADPDKTAESQLFTWCKQGRPIRTKHGDTVYLETHLNHFMEYRYFEDDRIFAKRWERRRNTTMTILKKAVVESKTTELARRFQFQAFDLDGNGNITKAELDQILFLVRGVEVPEEEINAMMNAADPSGSGQITYEKFAKWADEGGMTEEELQHVECLGNIAQRCNDSIHDDEAFIEVMGTVAVKTAMDMQVDFTNKLKAGDMAEKIIAKAAKESDGWFFSGNWKKAMQALLEQEVDLWVRCLDDAMRGWGTDEDSLTAIICTMPERLRADIFEGYFKKTGKHLLTEMRAETNGWFGKAYSKLLQWQAMAPEDCRATILNNAMVGLGTNEKQLIYVICQLNFDERKRVREAYFRMYQRDLVEHVMDETSGYFEKDFQRALKIMLEAEEQEFDLEADCKAMKEAMDGWGADQEKLTKLVCSKTSKQMTDIREKYYELFGEQLLDRVKSETGGLSAGAGYYQDVMLGCIRHPMTQLAHSVRECMKGWGVSKDGLCCLLVHLPDFKKAALISTYAKEHKGRNLLEDLKSETSGDFELALLSLVKPAPEVWAHAMRGAMKGWGTSDQLLINFIILAKDEMMEARKAFSKENKQQLLEDWIEYDCGKGDYKNTLMMLAGRNSEDPIELLPLYWAQRCEDAINNVNTLMDVLVSMPSVAIKRHTGLYGEIYAKPLREDLEARCKEQCSWFTWTDWFKKALLALLDMPVERICRVAYEAMQGWGTDEYTLTAVLCTMPENLYGDIHKLYREKYGKKLLDHVKSETSFNYKKLLEYQTMPKWVSRATALNRAMQTGIFTSVAQDQLIRVVICSTMEERVNICKAYKEEFGKDLITHIKHECPSDSLKMILMAVLGSVHPSARQNYEADAQKLKSFLDGSDGSVKGLVKMLAGKTPQQVEEVKTKYKEMFDDQDPVEVLEAEGADWSNTVFKDPNFHCAVLGLLRDPITRHACAVRDCMVGWGTDDTGLITLLVHMTERQRRDLASKYFDIINGGDIYKAIKADTSYIISGDYQTALLALVKPVPQVWAEALKSSMKGFGTSDNLLINWMVLAKDRMDEVREAFKELNNGQTLQEWIDYDCSGADYKNLLLKLASRRCPRFNGQEVGLSAEPPANKDDAILTFNKCFNKLCKQRKESGKTLTPGEEDEQEMGTAFLYYGSKSSCAPNLDIPGLWDLTNACGFPPGDAGPDLVATFKEWNYSGSGEITWNDFVREMFTRINDPNHFEADPLAETIDALVKDWGPCEPVQVYGNGNPDDSGDEDEGNRNNNGGGGGGADYSQAFSNKTWKDLLRDIPPEVDGEGVLTGPWGEVVFDAVRVEMTVENFQAEYGDGPVGQIIDFMDACGHGGDIPAAEKKEEQSKGSF